MRSPACRPAAASIPARHPGHGDGRCESRANTADTAPWPTSPPTTCTAYDVHRAQVIGHCAPTTGIKPFTELVEKVMTREPYASARRVFWIVDNGSSHRGWTAAARLTDAHPNAQMIHLPVHASWPNQVEIYFSVVQRKLITPDDFADTDELARQITAFEKRYNHAARPFDWRFSRNDLNHLLNRLAA